MTEPPRQLAEITDYLHLVRAFRARAAELKIAIGSADAAALAGLPDRYLSKLLGPVSATAGKNTRRIGIISLGPILGLLGAKLILVEDVEALEHVRNRLVPRNESQMRVKSVHIEIGASTIRKARLKGGQNSRKYMSPKKASALARKAARARWGRKV